MQKGQGVAASYISDKMGIEILSISNQLISVLNKGVPPMRQILFVLLSASLVMTTPANAITVQQMKQRINNVTASKEQLLMALSEKIICKGDKKPICYSEAPIFEGSFAITKVSRPEDDKYYYILYQGLPSGWKPLYSRTMEFLNLDKWKMDKVPIPDPVARVLIQKLQALR